MIFIFTLKIGEMIQFDEYIFSDGWLNHQLVVFAGRNPRLFVFGKIEGIYDSFCSFCFIFC